MSTSASQTVALARPHSALHTALRRVASRPSFELATVAAMAAITTAVTLGVLDPDKVTQATHFAGGSRARPAQAFAGWTLRGTDAPERDTGPSRIAAPAARPTPLQGSDKAV